MFSFPSLFLVSIVGGFVGAMAGMGGGVILIPVLTFFGLEIKKAIAISMVSVIATSSGAASAYVKDHLTNLKIGMFLEMFTMAGALTGAWLTLSLHPRVLFMMFGGVLIVCWLALFVRSASWRPAQQQDRFSKWLEIDGQYYDAAADETVSYRAVRAYFGGPLMFIAGLLAGLLGIGAGAVKVLIHDLVMEMPPKVSTTTSNLIIGVTALSGASVYMASGLIDPFLAAPIILGVIVGAFIGTRVLVRLRNEAIQRVFMIVLLLLGVEMIVRGIRGS